MNFGVNITISTTHTFSFELGGLANLWKEKLEGSISGGYSYSEGTAIGAAGETPFGGEECYKYRMRPLLLVAELWVEEESQAQNGGPITSRLERPFWYWGNTLYVTVEMLVCKQRCCDCCEGND